MKSILNFIFTSNIGPWIFYGFMVLVTYILSQVIGRKLKWTDDAEEIDIQGSCLACGCLWPVTFVVIVIAILVLTIVKLGDKAVKYILRLF